MTDETGADRGPGAENEGTRRERSPRRDDVAPRTRPLLDRPPGERYLGPRRGADLDRAGRGVAGRSATGDRPSDDRLAALWPPLAVVIGGALVYTILGGILTVTAGLIIVAAFLGWLIGKLVARPRRAAAVGLVAIVAGLLGIWLFGRLEGGVLDPLTYLDEVQGWPLVALQLLAGGGLAAAASR